VTPSLLPAINASLNGLATVLLVVGFVLIKKKKIIAHRNCMLIAFAVSSLFLICYLVDKAIKRGAHTPFEGPQAVRILYYIILISHIILAISVPVFAILLIRLGLRGEHEKHRRIARWGFPIWLYVSITGVVIYFMLYHLNQAVPPALG
jgi:putative membrane protein